MILVSEIGVSIAASMEGSSLEFVQQVFLLRFPATNHSLQNQQCPERLNVPLQGVTDPRLLPHFTASELKCFVRAGM